MEQPASEDPQAGATEAIDDVPAIRLGGLVEIRRQRLISTPEVLVEPKLNMRLSAFRSAQLQIS